MSTKPTLTKFTAADGSQFSVTTRIIDGQLRIDLWRGKHDGPMMSGEFTARVAAPAERID